MGYTDLATRELADEYSSKASVYEAVWAPVLRGFSGPLLDRLPLDNAESVIEVGCGTGQLLADIHERASLLSRLVGGDRSHGMLLKARCNIGCVFAEMDARSLAVRNGGFDVAICVFMLFHVPEPIEAVRELRRVLRRGGSAGVAVWGSDPGLPGRSVWLEELDSAGASPDLRPPEVARHATMNTEAGLAAILSAGSFAAVRTWSVKHEYEWRADDLMAMQLGLGTVSRRLASLSEQKRRECIERAAARLARFGREELTYRTEVIYAVASAEPEDGRDIAAGC